jgi:hypothetical protein
MKKQTTIALAFAALLGLTGFSTAQAGDRHERVNERGYGHGYTHAQRHDRRHHRHVKRHARHHYNKHHHDYSPKVGYGYLGYQRPQVVHYVPQVVHDSGFNVVIRYDAHGLRF